MACRIVLPAWPTTLDCIAWSADNWIAVACGEQVAIITPHLADHGSDGASWRKVMLKVNAFTAREAPLLHPLGFENFSLGEEQSLRHVHALAWSPPRLASFGRCALALLSTNHVLSLWDCDGQPAVASNWHRAIVVNHAVQDFYKAHPGPANGLTGRDRVEAQQVRQRIRAFCWASQVTEDSDESAAITGPRFMAVSTEAEEVLILRIERQTPASDPKKAWIVAVIHSWSSRPTTAAAKGKLPPNGAVKDPLTHDPFIADHIAWGPWRHDAESGQKHATLSVLVRGQLLTTRIAMTALLPSSEKDTALPQLRPIATGKMQLRGPLTFADTTDYLLCSGDDVLLCIDTGLKPDHDGSITSHHLDGRWDEVSGLAVTKTRDGTLQVHITSHLSTAEAVTTTLSLPLDDKQSTLEPRWQQAINKCMAAYSEEEDLGGQVQERTWGIATSPQGDYFSTVTTILPGDAPSYLIPSEQDSMLEITDVEELPEDGGLLWTEGPLAGASTSAEALLFRLKATLPRFKTKPNVEQLMDLMLQTTGDDSDTQDGLPGHLSNGTDSGRRGPRARFYLHPVTRRRCFESLAQQALGTTVSVASTQSAIVQLLVAETCHLPDNAQHSGELDLKILSLHRHIRAKLATDSHTADGIDASETCALCAANIPFESINWSRCANGHEFTRCGLSFLSIQAPKISKYCTLCGVQYINEDKLSHLKSESRSTRPSDVSAPEEGPSEQDQLEDPRHITNGDSTSTEPSDSYAYMLFLTFDRCIYCGGGFFG